MRILHFCVNEHAELYRNMRQTGSDANKTVFMYEWHHYHMVDELRRAGHDVVFFNPAEHIDAPGSAATYSQALLDKVRAEMRNSGLDLLFATATDSMLLPGVIEEIRKIGLPTVNLSCDDYSHPYRVRRISRAFDINWSTVRENREVLAGYGANVTVMPWGANPHVFKPAVAAEDRVVGFVGTLYGGRARNVAMLALADVPVRVHGRAASEINRSIAKVDNPVIRAVKQWGEARERIIQSASFASGRACLRGVLLRSLQEMVIRPPQKRSYDHAVQYAANPSFEEMGECFARMALSLGSLELASTYVLSRPLLFIRLREFEVPMSGGVHLVNRSPELEEYFTDQREMLYYDGTRDLLDKARFYLDPRRDALRSNIRAAARKRAVGEHTWLHRFREIGRQLALSF